MQTIDFPTPQRYGKRIGREKEKGMYSNPGRSQGRREIDRHTDG